MTDLGPRLKAARKDLGWTLRKAADRSGVPNAHISQIETGAIWPRDLLGERLADDPSCE